MNNFQPGHHPGMTNDDYHAGPGVSKSHLDKMATSPIHYWQAYVNPEREISEPTPAMALGTATHAAILEPDDFTSIYVRAEKFDRRTKQGKQDAADFEAANEDKLILEPDAFDACLAMRDAVHRHPVARGLFTGGIAEQTFFAIDPETGELIKTRVDYLNAQRGMIVDLKTTDDASPKGFGKSAANFRYDLQCPWYKDVLAAMPDPLPIEHFVFVAVEKKPPYAIGIYFVDAATEARARIAARRDFLRIVECRRRDDWPDFGAEALPLQIPNWADR